MEILGSNLSLLIWILIFIFTLKVIKKIIKKTIHIILIIVVLVFLGIIPAPTNKLQIDTKTEGYSTEIQSAALWRIEDNIDNNGERTLYLLNNIPIKLGTTEIEEPTKE